VPAPVIVSREGHPISRRQIDPDALKVLGRLQQHDRTAYLVGGGVRDLMLGRRPKDFDIATDAHPYQIKKLFRNCWIIGRRFRLAHIKFGQKTIEVATFRRIVNDPPVNPAPAADGTRGARSAAIIKRDNTFGTPEEDAFRRDFTMNALFYDPATRSVIDYVGGLEDLEHRTIRSIGDPNVRFDEDPVRMLRAAVFAARLGFDMDAAVLEAIAEHRGLIAEASPARLLEEYFKILRSGYAEASFRALARVRLLEVITPELASPSDAIWDSLARLDRYRQDTPEAPPEFTNAVLIGALLEPLGLLRTSGSKDERVTFGTLPVARRDLERLRQVKLIVPRLTQQDLPPRLERSLPLRPAFADAVTWLEVVANDPDGAAPWKRLRAARPAKSGGSKAAGESATKRRRRRRRRGGRRRKPASSGDSGPA
jgi:poly(A) polymerase